MSACVEGFLCWINTNGQGLGSLLQGLGAIATALGVVWGFKYTGKQLQHAQTVEEAKKRDASLQAMTELHRNFYQTRSIPKKVRYDFEYEFDKKWAPAMEKYLVYPARLNDVERECLCNVDALLNFFEHVAYLGKSSLHTDDRDAMFKFWFDTIMKQPSHAILRRYILLGFESLVERTEFATLDKKGVIQAPPVYMAVYGTLMPSEYDALPNDAKEKVKPIRQNMKRRGVCWLPGDLYDLGRKMRYPGYWPSKKGWVKAELVELGEDDVRARPTIRVLDNYEEIHDEHPEYVRHFILVADRKGGPLVRGAWVYILAQDPAAARLQKIESGDWVSFRKSGYQNL